MLDGQHVLKARLGWVGGFRVGGIPVLSPSTWLSSGGLRWGSRGPFLMTWHLASSRIRDRREGRGTRGETDQDRSAVLFDDLVPKVVLGHLSLFIGKKSQAPGHAQVATP